MYICNKSTHAQNNIDYSIKKISFIFNYKFKFVVFVAFLSHGLCVSLLLLLTHSHSFCDFIPFMFICITILYMYKLDYAKRCDFAPKL